MNRFFIACIMLFASSISASAQYYSVMPYYGPVVVPAPIYRPAVVPVAVPVYRPVAVSVPVVVPAPVVVRAPICGYIADPYDLIGQVFGDPDLIQTCW